MTKQKKFILSESEIPTQWYNILMDMPNKPLPPIHPATKQPLTWQDLKTYLPGGVLKTGTGHGAPLDRYPRGGAGEV